ncbi:hypothetical protein [Altererythrobacter sp. GH1-8]|uniref:hypothetical protein n=1 Tax=Altererythrobacter sp. GH1-8 TaxID=3349333 RepID=UPI00374DDB7A
MDGPTVICLVLVALASAATLNAQETEDQPVEASAGTEQDAAPVSIEDEISDPSVLPDARAETPARVCSHREARAFTLPKLTPVYISVDAPLGSKTSTTGETFPITVTEAVIVDGVEVIPVGTKGEGEVIHAKKAGGSGSGGELILTANYIALGEQKIPLRSMELGVTGKDQTDLALATGIFAGPIGFLVRGKNIDVPEGMLAGAKLAQDTQISLAGDADVSSDECTEGTEKDEIH